MKTKNATRIIGGRNLGGTDMAKLSAHGVEIGRIRYTTYAKAYFADGKILKNSGDGWKLYRKMRNGYPIHVEYDNAVKKQQEVLANRPALVAYRKALHSITGIGKASKLHTAIQAMPDDCDGVWSEVCDGYGDNVSADVDDIGELCELFRAAEKEKQKTKADQTEAAAA